jgi:hypothetical protein
MVDPKVITTSQQLTLDVWDVRLSAMPESWQNCILSSFVPSLARGWARQASDADWTRARKRAMAILQSPTTWVSVACAQGDEEQAQRLIVGWLAHARNILHYVHVKTGYRGAGVGDALLKSAVLDPSVPCTHWSKKLPPNGWKVRGERLFFYCGVDRIRGHDGTLPER